MFDYYKIAFDDVTSIIRSLLWPVLIYVLTNRFRNEVGEIIKALSERIASMKEVRALGGRVTFVEGGKVQGLNRARVQVPKPADASDTTAPTNEVI